MRGGRSVMDGGSKEALKASIKNKPFLPSIHHLYK